MYCKKLPRDLNLYQTSKCNFNCSFCKRAKGEVPKAPDVTPELVGQILKKFPIRSCCIAGFGEPLASKGLFKVIDYLNNNGIVPSIITNGSMVMERFDEVMEYKFLYMNVSLNTADSGRHEYLTGTKTFSDVIDGITWLVEYAEFPVMLSMIVFRDNYTEIPEFLELANTLEVDRMVLINPLPYDKEAAKGTITSEDVEIIRKVEGYKHLADAKIVAKWPKWLGKPKHVCDSPYRSIGVDGNGSITGCRRVHGPEKDYGNISDKDVWNNKYILELRNGVRGKGRFSWYCNRCFGNVS